MFLVYAEMSKNESNLAQFIEPVLIIFDRRIGVLLKKHTGVPLLLYVHISLETSSCILRLVGSYYTKVFL